MLVPIHWHWSRLSTLYIESLKPTYGCGKWVFMQWTHIYPHPSMDFVYNTSCSYSFAFLITLSAVYIKVLSDFSINIQSFRIYITISYGSHMLRYNVVYIHTLVNISYDFVCIPNGQRNVSFLWISDANVRMNICIYSYVRTYVRTKC